MSRHAGALSLPALRSKIYDPTDASNKLWLYETWHQHVWLKRARVRATTTTSGACLHLTLFCSVLMTFFDILIYKWLSPFSTEKKQKNLKVFYCRFSTLNSLWAVSTDCSCWFAWVDASHMIKSDTAVKCQLVLHGQKSFYFLFSLARHCFFPLPLSFGVCLEDAAQNTTYSHIWVIHSQKERAQEKWVANLISSKEWMSRVRQPYLIKVVYLKGRGAVLLWLHGAHSLNMGFELISDWACYSFLQSKWNITSITHTDWCVAMGSDLHFDIRQENGTVGPLPL